MKKSILFLSFCLLAGNSLSAGLSDWTIWASDKWENTRAKWKNRRAAVGLLTVNEEIEDFLRKRLDKYSQSQWHNRDLSDLANNIFMFVCTSPAPPWVLHPKYDIFYARRRETSEERKKFVNAIRESRVFQLPELVRQTPLQFAAESEEAICSISPNHKACLIAREATDTLRLGCISNGFYDVDKHPEISQLLEKRKKNGWAK